MKHLHLFFLLSLTLSGLLFSAVRLKKSTLTGVAYEAGTNAPLAGAAVRITQHQTLAGATLTDAKGQYKITLAPGVYDVTFSYIGKITKRITAVTIGGEKELVLNILLEPASELEETVVLLHDNYEKQHLSGEDVESLRAITKPKIAELAMPAAVRVSDSPVPEPPSPPTASPSGAVLPATTSEEYDAKEMKEVVVTKISSDLSAVPSKPVALTARYHSAETASKVSGKGDRTKSKDYYADDRRPAPTDVKTDEGKMVDTDRERVPDLDKNPSETVPTQPAPRTGLLTAGEWNDLHNWNKHWLDLLTDGEIAEHQKTYQFFPRHRCTVLLTNEQDVPLADVPVQLVSGTGETLWEARTDNTGKAELWAGFFDAKSKDTTQLRAVLTVNGRKHTLPSLKPAKDGMNRLKVAAPCAAPKNVDIVWAVDATGSMGDEIEYLKTELLDVMGRTRSALPDISFRMGTVFYRDITDDYLVKSSALSYDMGKTIDFMRKQSSGGGGDFPEAVHSALEEAIFNQRWSENAIARICFLVLDASPHQTPEINASLQRSIREAARRGIRIIPVASSGIQKDTEFLMKFFGLATNGTYVFLTDHSGIGGKHLAPTADEYKIENLNNLLIRLITEYSASENCEGKSAIRFEDQQQAGNVWQALYYPNPAAGQFTLELPVTVQTVTLYNSEGQAVKKMEQLTAGQHRVELGDLSDGFYTIRILKDAQWQSGKLVVARE